MLDQSFSPGPRAALEVTMPERSDQQLGLVEPRGVRRREAGPPPTTAPRAILLGVPRRVAWVTVLYQEYPPEPMVSLPKRPQFPDVVPGVLSCLDGQFH